jgi:hypothetical protein
MTVAVLVVFLLIVVPVATGAVVQMAWRPSAWRGSRRLTLRATIGLLLLSDVIGSLTTPQSACGRTGCDTGYGVGLFFAAPFVYGLVLLGAWIGRVAQPTERRSDAATTGQSD